MHEDIEEILYDQDAIAARIAEVGRQITADLTGDGPEPPRLTLVPILTGSIIFVADLIRHLPLPMRISLVSVSSYPGTSTSSQGTKLRGDLTELGESITGTHALIVDDILDSGRTLRLVRDLVAEHGPLSVRTCVLLRKRRPEAMAFELDYCCFDIPDKFVVGCGLDYDGLYRNYPHIGVLSRRVIEDEPPK